MFLLKKGLNYINLIVLAHLREGLYWKDPEYKDEH